MDRNVNDYLISPDTLLIDAMKKIDMNTKGIVYVCQDKRLIGVITDGDIRRYILKNASIEGTAEDIMNSSPKFIYYGEDINANEYMKTHFITSLPILDKNKNIIEIKFLDKTKSKKESLNIPVVIMAGGKGTRLYPYTQILPKPLIPINDKTITEIIMDHFEEYDCKSFIMIVNYKKEFIKAFFKENEQVRDVHFYDENTFMGTAGGLKLLKNEINETFFMSNCDVLIEEDYSEILKYHKTHKNIITMVCALKKEIFPYGTIETNEKGNVLKLKEKPSFEFLTNTGLYVIEPEFLDFIPDDTFIHITDVIQKCIDEGLNVGVYPIREESWMDMGQLEELEKMRERINGK